MTTGSTDDALETGPTEPAETAPQPVIREIGIDEAVVVAVECQRSGRLDDAEALFRRILEIEPDRPDALHYSGVLAHQQGRLEEATVRLQRSLEIDPNQPDCLANLGINLHARGRVEEAIDACRRAIALDPGHANAYSNLGALLKGQGHVEEAEDAYRTAIRLNPEHVGAYINLGILVGSQGRLKDSVNCYCKVITLWPTHPQAKRLLALAHTTLGELDKAEAIYQEWLREEPDDPIARHMHAAVTGRDVPARGSDAYITAIFDGFADSFDFRLAHLGYRAPSLVAEMLRIAVAEPANQYEILDAGCGTGLCGPLVAPYARRLVGVDLSSRMLSQAAERRVYHELVQMELTTYLRGAPGAFDVVLSADTLVYFGGLEEVVSAAAAALRPGGLLIFTVEELRNAGAETNYAMAPHGRFSHAERYVEGVLAGAGLQASIAAAELRMEGGEPVHGLVIRATTAAGEGASHA